MELVMLGLVALALIVLYIGQYGTDISAARRLDATAPWYRLPILRALWVFVALLVVPPLAVGLSGFGAVLPVDGWLLGFSTLIAGLISYTWYRYLSWLDVYEPEKRWAMLLVVVLSSISTLFVPDLYRVLESATGMALDGEFWNDMFYSFAIIGGLEELAKLIPYLILLRFTKRINEPYDHLLYLSLSALGFAFVENIMYLYSSGLTAVAGRALYASVAHMCFSSIIGYGVAISLHRGTTNTVLVGVLMYLLASLAHAFYDVWLLAPGRPAVLTTIFFLGTIQLWVIMKNNLINLSPFAEPHRKLRSTMFRYRIINAMLAIFMLAFVAIFLMAGSERAWGMLAGQALTMIVMLLILAFSFGNYHVVPGYVARLHVSRNPARWFMPIATLGAEFSGMRVRIDIPEHGWKKLDMPELRRALPVMGLLERRVVYAGDADWYLFRPERRLDLGHGYTELFLMKLDAEVDTIPADSYVRMALARFEGTPRIVDGEVQGKVRVFATRVFAQLIPNMHGGSGLAGLGGHGLN
jgi:RsiW-degrading membrane proteinase PrsW (M82 family)